MLNKKHIAYLFLFIFLFSNVGWSINVHYCNGDSTSNFSYLHHIVQECTMETEVDSCCETPEVKADTNQQQVKSRECCKDEVITSSVTDQTINKNFPINLEAICPNLSWTNITYTNLDYTINKQESLNYYVDSNAPPLYKLYCCLVLYA